MYKLDPENANTCFTLGKLFDEYSHEDAIPYYEKQWKV